MYKSPLSLIVFLFFTFFLNAQEAQKDLVAFVKQTHATVTVNENSGVPEFIKFAPENFLDLEGVTIQDKAFYFLEKYKAIFQLSAVEASFKVEDVKTDAYGFNRITLKQVHQNVPVYDGKLRFHFNAENKLTAVNGNFIPNIKIDATPAISPSEAASLAIQTVNNQKLNTSGLALEANNNTLYLFQKGLAQGNFTTRHLVYEVEVRNGAGVREFVFIDAHSKELVEQFTGMPHALYRVIYEGNMNNTVWEEGDPLPGTLSTWQLNEVEASGHVYHLFNNTFGQDSYDGIGAQMKTINNNPNINCPNANWNGVTVNYCDGIASDDVIAHEWGHAYTEYTSGLIYAWQSGAINESYSDIWGETVDILNAYGDQNEDLSLRTDCSNSQRWKIGESATAISSPIRDMWNPNCKNHPGKVTDNNYWCNEGDNGGVHINSGVPNHAYALLVDGGTFNGYTINGLGFTKAAHIFWRAQSTYLTATSDFYNLADALEASCTDLLGINLEGLSFTSTPAGPSGEIITSTDFDELVNVLLAVELKTNPDACNFETILGPIFELCPVAEGNPVYKQDWETGLQGWTVSELPLNPLTWESRDWTIVSSLPDGREGQGVFGANPVNGDCQLDLQDGLIRLESPLITLPDFTDGDFQMFFDHFVATEYEWDGGNIKYSVDNGLTWAIVPSSAFTANPYNATLRFAQNTNPLRGEEAFTGTDGGSVSGSWGRSVIDLSAIGVGANDAVKFRWELGSDACNGRIGWYLDDIAIFNCAMPLSVTDFNVVTNSVKVYPNPSNGVFTLKKTQNIHLSSAKIHDINGRVIKEFDLSNMQMKKDMDLTHLSSGIYFVTITSPEAKTVLKLVKQ
ncbi:M4 family metallopeptidase [Oceanihabitans sediminis]|uniref:M4 family metallopeptidase n=1 Tax=Oceanihabitans sediminis TaxID=1812012 RepID=UPI003A8CC783